jgi:hypothetical protein
MAGRLSLAIFSNGRIIDPSAPPLSRPLLLNVLARPTPKASADLVSLLESHGLAVQLGDVRKPAPLPAPDTVVRHPEAVAAPSGPLDQFRITGNISAESLFDVLAEATFGPKQMFRASVVEYGHEYVGVEIVDRTARPRPPLQRPRPAPPSTPPSTPLPTQGPPVTAVAVAAQTAPRPALELRLTQVFDRAVSQGRRP